MLKRVFDKGAGMPDATEILIHFLQTGNDVIRTDAVRALSKHVSNAKNSDSVRAELLKALLDEDPDVRCDAMEALVDLVNVEDAETLRESLLGDPVREVKLAAIQALTRLGDNDSISILCSLAESRCEEEVAWEDENDVWDDWLDVQKAAILALGELRATQAIPVISAARQDEFGQNLDVIVFNVLGKMGQEGLSVLIDIAKAEPGHSRKRALEVLADQDKRLLEDQLQFLLDDDVSEVRLLALPFLEPTGQTATNIALTDADPVVRSAALSAFGPDAPKLAVSALSDSSDLVKATALELLPLPLSEKLTEVLIANLELWLKYSGPTLSATSAKLLLTLNAEEAIQPLLNLARDSARPLEARIAAVDALGQFDDLAAYERMIDFLGNDARQVRVVALTHLANFAKQGDEKSKNALTLAVSGILLPPDKATISRDDENEDSAPDLATPKMDLPNGGKNLRITPEGDVLESTNALIDNSVSTLAAIQVGQSESKETENRENLAEDTPEESGRKRSKRRAVEGPDEISQDLACAALTIVADIPGEDILSAIIGATHSENLFICEQAYHALLRRSACLPGEFNPEDCLDAITDALACDTPIIRSIAAELASALPETVLKQKLRTWSAFLDDPNPNVRALAVRFENDLETLGKCLSDSSEIVRKSALEKLFEIFPNNDASASWESIAACERVDIIATAIKAYPFIYEQMLDSLNKDDISARQTHILLQAMIA